MVDWSHSARTSRRSQLRQLDLGSHWDWDYMVTFCDGEHILFGRLSICPQKKIPILNWCSGMIGWGTSRTIGTARIAWLSSNGGSVTSSHHDLCHDRHHNFQWSHPYCLHHCQRRHHHHRKHEKPIIFLFFISKLLFGQDPVGFGIYHWNDWDCNQLARWFS